jgi:hypothetical protein
MDKRGCAAIPKIWVELIIICLIILSVLGAILLTQQDQPMQPEGGSVTDMLSRTPEPVTPTPTPVVTSGVAAGPSTPIPTLGMLPVTGTLSEDGPATPAPTPIVLPTVMSWTE